MFARWIYAFFLSLFLVACGGGGGGEATGTPVQNGSDVGNDGGTGNPSGGGTSTPPPQIPGGNDTPPPSDPGDNPPPPDNSGGGSGGGTGGDTDGNSGSPPDEPPASTFAATVTDAPADGATISGTVRILVEGSGIRNVELLPESGYEPLIVRGVVNGDNTGAHLDFDTSVLPDGQITLRVVAFNAAPGGGGSEITAMRPRTWTVANSAAPVFSAQLVTAPETTAETFWLGSPPGGGTFSDTVYFEVSGTGLENVELVSAKDESVIYGRFTISPDKTRATLDWEYGSFEGWSYGTYELRVVAWDVPPGESGRSIEVMAPRTYYNKLPLGCQAEGTCGGAAP